MYKKMSSIRMPLKYSGRIMNSHICLPWAKTQDEKTKRQCRIDITAQKIDHPVYELYKRAGKKIEIVEGKKNG